LLKLGKHQAALGDAVAAIHLDASCELAYYRKGVASFSLGEYEIAQQALLRGQQLYNEGQKDKGLAERKTDTRRYSMWLRKCEAELEALSDSDGDEPAAKRAAGAANITAPKTTVVPTTTAQKSAKKPEAPRHLATRFQYYQTDDKVHINILEKDVKEEDATVNIGTNRYAEPSEHC
jgi:hypothetical protein